MTDNFKNIHIGSLIKNKAQECQLDLERASLFLNLSKKEIEQLYSMKSIDSALLLRWSKLLKYDFFRIYSQHLILYAPQSTGTTTTNENTNSALPVFRKNMYTQEVIDYIVELVTTNKMTIMGIHKKYNIPSTTIRRWVNKYDTK